MITAYRGKALKEKRAEVIGDASFGNSLFQIASTIGIATKNGYSYGFDWINRDYFVNQVPQLTQQITTKFQMPANYMGYDFGFTTWNVPDNVHIAGEIGTEKYFKHCEDLIRHYFTMKKICEPLKDCILMHYRDYNKNPAWVDLDSNYYNKALSHLPSKKVVVITDNIEKAKHAIQLDCEYISNSPIMDFYLLANADYLVMANSTFSWWGAWLSKAQTIAPKDWYAGEFKNAPVDELYCKEWLVI